MAQIVQNHSGFRKRKSDRRHDNPYGVGRACGDRLPPGRHAAAEHGRVHVDDLPVEFIEIEHRDTAAAGAFAQYPLERHDWAFLSPCGPLSPFYLTLRLLPNIGTCTSHSVDNFNDAKNQANHTHHSKYTVSTRDAPPSTVTEYDPNTYNYEPNRHHKVKHSHFLFLN
jgi:hypothetical protein